MTDMASPILALAAEQFGRRRKIGRAEMREFLARLATRGFDLGNPYMREPSPEGWANACKGMMLISLIDRRVDPGAPASITDAEIRYDEPGNTYPGFRVTLMFAPAALADAPQMRRYAQRLLIVADE